MTSTAVIVVCCILGFFALLGVAIVAAVPDKLNFHAPTPPGTKMTALPAKPPATLGSHPPTGVTANFSD